MLLWGLSRSGKEESSKPKKRDNQQKRHRLPNKSKETEKELIYNLIVLNFSMHFRIQSNA